MRAVVFASTVMMPNLGPEMDCFSLEESPKWKPGPMESVPSGVIPQGELLVSSFWGSRPFLVRSLVHFV